VVTTSGPAARAYHTAVTVADGVLLFGGRNELLQVFNDLWKFNPLSETWGRVVPMENDVPPSARFWHASARLGNNMFVFGGFTWEHADVVNDLWEYNLLSNQWSLLIPNGDIDSPRPRHGHTMVSTGLNTLLVFGGRNNGRPELTTFNDLWEYNITSAKWTQLKAQNDPSSPPQRCGLTATAINIAGNNQMVIFGGTAPQSPTDVYYNDVWKYTRSSNSWEMLQPNTGTPLAGPGQIASIADIHNPQDTAITFFGGYELFVGLHNYVWQMSGY